MSKSLQLGYPDVPRSITNPNVDIKNAIDIDSPMSFLEFIKNINISLEPETTQEYYTTYITKWNTKNSKTSSDDKQTIVEKYKDFLRDVIIQYSTLEEKKFLSSIDFNDPFDLDIAINFYSKKLKELCDYYNNKRQDLKHSVLRKKLNGSMFGLTQTIQDLVISYIKNFEDSKMIFDLESIISKLEIEIEELYDTYPLYYNQIPNEKIYDNKDLDYGLNIFLRNDEELISEVFKGSSEEIKKLKEVDQIFENKRKLTQKYIATDFYFLSTGSNASEFLSGKLFDNDNTIFNFLNRFYPTTASSKKEEFYKSPREQGFFRPHNVSFVLVNGVTKSFSINPEKLQKNTLYFFPDPQIFASDLEIISFSIDDTFLKRNVTSGNAANQPTSSKNDTKYYGYHSEIDPTEKKYLSSVFNAGYIKEYKQDIYNNTYGLFKSGFDQYIKNIDDDYTTYNVIINGYEFYDEFYNEGFSFDYTIEDNTTYTELIRTGLSANTLGFYPFVEDVKLSFGRFSNFYELAKPTEEALKTTYRNIDGLVFTRRDLSLLPDPISSDLYIYETSSDSFYYDTLIEGGISLSVPQYRALKDPAYPSLVANFVSYDRLSTFTVTGGRFEEKIPSSTVTKNSVFIPDVENTTEVLPMSSFDEYDGSLFIKNTNTGEVKHLLDALPYLNARYPANIVGQLADVAKFDICYDVIAIQTENYLLFEKIIVENNEFQNPKISLTYHTHNATPFNKVSNRIKIGSKIYYVITDSDGSNISYDLKVYPQLYRYDVNTNQSTLLYPTPNSDLDPFLISNSDVEYQKLDTPILSYSSRNNIFSLTFLLKDQNNYPVIKNYDFEITPDVEFIKSNTVKLSNELNSSVFYPVIPSTLSFYLSSTITTINQGMLII